MKKKKQQELTLMERYVVKRLRWENTFISWQDGKEVSSRPRKPAEIRRMIQRRKDNPFYSRAKEILRLIADASLFTNMNDLMYSISMEFRYSTWSGMKYDLVVVAQAELLEENKSRKELERWQLMEIL